MKVILLPAFICYNVFSLFYCKVKNCYKTVPSFPLFRPDLVDFRKVQVSTPRQNLEQAFSIAETEFGVTRLLDPEGNHFCDKNQTLSPKKHVFFNLYMNF